MKLGPRRSGLELFVVRGEWFTRAGGDGVRDGRQHSSRSMPGSSPARLRGCRRIHMTPTLSRPTRCVRASASTRTPQDSTIGFETLALRTDRLGRERSRACAAAVPPEGPHTSRSVGWALDQVEISAHEAARSCRPFPPSVCSSRGRASPKPRLPRQFRCAHQESMASNRADPLAEGPGDARALPRWLRQKARLYPRA